MNPFRLSARLRAPQRAGSGSRAAGAGSDASGSRIPRASPPGFPAAPDGEAAPAAAREGSGGAAGPAGAGRSEHPVPPAPLPVPWRVVTRSASAVIEIEHCGSTPLHSVRFALAGAGMLGLSLPRAVLPGERLRVSLRGVSAETASGAGDAMLVLRWFQPDGTELLWPIAL